MMGHTQMNILGVFIKKNEIINNKPKMAYSRDLPKMAVMDDHGLSTMIMDYNGLSWTIMDDHE